jgi:hypothetical protein
MPELSGVWTGIARQLAAMQNQIGRLLRKPKTV